MRRLATFVIISGLLIAGVFVYQNLHSKEITTPENQSVLLAEAIPTELQSSTPLPAYNPPDALCNNEAEVEDFKKPVPIIWEARMDGCLSGCQGASFTRLPESKEYKYPRFAGYYPDKYGGYTGDGISPIEEEFRQDDIILRVHGDWISIDADHPYTVFSNQCVPIVNIKKLEIVKRAG